jgi:hypothetical protein
MPTASFYLTMARVRLFFPVPLIIKTVIGHGLPKFELGWTNTFVYKRLDLNFFLRGSFGHGPDQYTAGVL